MWSFLLGFPLQSSFQDFFFKNFLFGFGFPVWLPYSLFTVQSFEKMSCG